MTSGISAVQSSQIAITTSPGVRSSSSSVQPSSQPSAGSVRAAANAEDSVQLSSSAQQYLAQASSTQALGQVAQLVRDAAEGYTGALSLLTIV